MVTVLPVRIKFRLPDGWVPAPPDEVGEPGAAFVAVHPTSVDDRFTGNITISGQTRPRTESLEQLADAAATGMRSLGTAVQVADRRHIGSGRAPGLMQVLRVLATIRGKERRLVQAQVFLSFPTGGEPAGTAPGPEGTRSAGASPPGSSETAAVVKLALTTTAGQFPGLIRDFQQFVRSVRPAPETGGSA